MHRRLLVLLLVFVLVAGQALAAPRNQGAEFLAKVDAAVSQGELTFEQGLLFKFYYGFEPERLPAEFRPAEFSPLKNGTEIVWEFEAQRDRLSPATVETIDRYLNPAPPGREVTATYLSPSGRFRLTYYTSGGDAVPATDVDPANGIPDFVEKVATYCDYSWDLEITTMGFTAPPLTPYYEIGFENMSYYGYTTVVSGTQTRIVLHNDFLGFPPNDDPEGNQWGAAKVTVAHEFKHASQRAQSYWSEGGWVEVDATWMEDIAYDYVNDYYNYLPSGSPISHPATSLDSGGSGSYEDCVWQHWMSETWGNQIIVDFWNWRTGHQGQAVMDSYEQMLINYGTTLTDGWAIFAAWNYATNYRAITGLGYGEAAEYPLGSPVATFTSYPASHSGSVAHLAANFVRCQSIGGGSGSVRVVFNGANGSAIRLTAIIEKTDGTGVIEPVVLDAQNDADTNLSVPLDQIYEVGFAIGNGAESGGNLSWSLTVSQDVAVPQPQLSVDITSVTKSMEPDQTDTEYMQLTNTGEPGSVLNYNVSVQSSAAKTPTLQRNISGSTLTCGSSEYVPGTTVNLSFTVYNASTDDEWLTDVTLDFPVGVFVNSSTSFVGGSYGDMISDGATGNGALVSWHGDTGAPYYYGVVDMGEYATATVNVTFDGGLSGDVDLPYTITGDQWGDPPHTVGGTITLDASGPTLTVLAPNGGEVLAVGDPTTITWTSSGGLTNVKIDLSRDGGSGWEAIVASTANDGSYGWTVTGPPATTCLVRVSSLDETVSDTSNAPFTIFQPVNWLTVAPESGDLNQGETDVIDLNFDTAGLAPDTYQAYIVITHDAPGSPDVVPVTLTVTDPTTGAGDAPLVFQLDGNFPNPFNPRTLISFTLPQTGAARVEVLDLRGRLVRTLWQGELVAGPHQIPWDGTDGAGRPVAAGTYLARLLAGDLAATSKMALTK